MNLAKITKDVKSDLKKYKNEILQKKTLNSKQKEQRTVRADKREERHRVMRQGIHNMLHEQMKLIDQVNINIKR